MPNTKKVSRLTQLINKAKETKRFAHVPFLTAGIPDRETFWGVLEELAHNGCDVLEIGVPFSDPVADGPVVAKASEKALADGIGMQYILDGLKRHQKRFNGAGIVLMGYANPFLQYAWAKSGQANAKSSRVRPSIQELMVNSLSLLGKDLKASGVDGLIIPDLQLGELKVWKAIMQSENVDIIALVGPNTSLERMQEYAKDATGYVYVTSVTGITGVRTGLPPEAAEAVKKAHEAFDLPVALGFGIKEPAQLAELSKESSPEAVVFGSALIDHLNAGGTAKDFMQRWLE